MALKDDGTVWTWSDSSQTPPQARAISAPGFAFKASDVTIDPGSGTYETSWGIDVALRSAMQDVLVRYTLDGSDPASATEWAQTISDPFERVGASVSAFARWAQKDKAAARLWLDSAPVTEREFYDRILNDPKYQNGFD